MELTPLLTQVTDCNMLARSSCSPSLSASLEFYADIAYLRLEFEQL